MVRLDAVPIQLLSLPNISVLPGSPGLLLSPIVLVSPPMASRCAIEVLEPLDWPSPCSHCPCCVKTPRFITFLSPSPPPIPVKRAPLSSLVVFPPACYTPTISIPSWDIPILVLPTLRKRAHHKLSLSWTASSALSSFPFFFSFKYPFLFIVWEGWWVQEGRVSKVRG